MNYPFQPMPMMNFPYQAAGKLTLAPALYVGDLDEAVTEEQLYDFFSRFGPIHFVRIMRDSQSGRSRGYGFVNFVYPRDAEIAKQSAQYELLGRRHIRIMFKRNVRDLPPEANLYVKNLDPKVNVKDLYQHFSTIGPIICCKVAADRDGNSLGYGYVQFEKPDDAQIALQKLQGSKLKENEVQLVEFLPKDKRSSESNSRRNIYVKNLPVNKSEQEVDKLITDLFGKYGEIEMKLIKKHPTESKYSAFICFKDEENARKAFEDITKNPPLIDGAEEKLYVNWYQGKNERQRDLKGRFAHSANETNLYLKNLAETTTESELKDVFQAYGKVTSVAIREWTQPTTNKKSKYGFVAFENKDDANRAKSEALQNQEIRTLFLQGVSPYINLHQSKERRSEYLNSLRRRKMQTGFADMFGGQQPYSMPFVPFRRFQAPYNPNYQGGNKPMYNKPGTGPKNFGGNKQFNTYKDRNQGPQGKYNNAPNRNYQQNQQKPIKKQENTQQSQSSTQGPQSSNQGTITVQNLKSKLNEFLSLDQDKQRQILGELLFPFVLKFAGENLAPKITGMLIDLDVLEVTEILEFLEDPDLLKERVDEAKSLILTQEGQ